MSWGFTREQRREFGRRGALAKMARYEATAAERFWANVDKNGPVIREELGPCWIWTAGKTSGYGTFRWRGKKNVRAHRVAFELIHGRPPVGFLLHDCDNRPCVRHVREGTQAENIMDAYRRGRLTPPSNKGMKFPNRKRAEKRVQHG